MEMSKGGYTVEKPVVRDLSPAEFVKLINFSSTAAVVVRIRVGIGTDLINTTKVACRDMADHLEPGETIRVETLPGYEIVTIIACY